MKLFLILISFIITSCSAPKVKPKEEFIKKDSILLSYWDTPLHWKTFPIKVHFHKGFPKDKMEQGMDEINQLNKELGFTFFEIQEIYEGEILIGSGIKKNVIYWGNSSLMKMERGNQGQTEIYWRGNSLENFSMRFDKHLASLVDFRTLFRHELAHAMGLKHTDEGLMTEYLGIGEVKGWGDLLVKFKQEMTNLGAFKRNSIESASKEK